MGRTLSGRVLRWCMRLAGQRTLVVGRRPGDRLRVALLLAIGPALLLTAALLLIAAVALFALGR